MDKGFRLSEGFVLALFPLFGIAVIAFHQLGRHFFYGIPLEFFELDTAKVILSAAPFTLYGLAIVYSVALLYDSTPAPSSKWRPLGHLFLAGFVTVPFWIGSLGVGAEFSWPTIALIAFFAACTWAAEHFWKKLVNKGPKARRVEALAGISLAIGALVLIGAFTHGAILARDQASRTFIGGTNQIVVLRSGDLLITKTYEPSSRSLVADRTALVLVSDVTMLESRKAPID